MKNNNKIIWNKKLTRQDVQGHINAHESIIFRCLREGNPCISWLPNDQTKLIQRLIKTFGPVDE